MAPTYDLTSGVYSKPVDALNKVYVMKNVISFIDNPVSAAETMAIFNLPANTLAMEVFALVTTADTGQTDFDVGIFGVSADGFIDGGSAASATWVRDYSGETYSPPAGYLTTTDKQIYFTANTAAMDGAVIEFFVLCVDLN